MLAIPVPTTPNMAINKSECCTTSLSITVMKLVLSNTNSAGKNSTKKLPVVMLNGFQSDKYFFNKFTFKA